MRFLQLQSFFGFSAGLLVPFAKKARNDRRDHWRIRRLRSNRRLLRQSVSEAYLLAVGSHRLPAFRTRRHLRRSLVVCVPDQPPRAHMERRGADVEHKELGGKHERARTELFKVVGNLQRNVTRKAFRVVVVLFWALFPL